MVDITHNQGQVEITISDSDLNTAISLPSDFSSLKIIYTSEEKGKTKFVSFLKQILFQKRQLKCLDISGIDLTSNELRSIMTCILEFEIPISQLNLSANRQLGSDSHHNDRRKGPLYAAPDVMLKLHDMKTLKQLNWSNTVLFSPNDEVNLRARSMVKTIASQIHRYSSFDLTNTHRPEEQFTAEQLYLLVKTNKVVSPDFSFLISTAALPEAIYLQLKEEIGAETAFNLFRFREEIIKFYWEEYFSQVINEIQSDKQANPYALTTSFAELTTEQTERLAVALSQEDCKQQRLALPSCNLCLLENALVKNKSITMLDLSQIEPTDAFLISLCDILAENTAVIRLKLNWQIVNDDKFSSLLTAILANEETGLTIAREQAAQSFIEFVIPDFDKEPRAFTDSELEKILCKGVPPYCQFIRIVIDMAQLSPGLKRRLFGAPFYMHNYEGQGYGTVEYAEERNSPALLRFRTNNIDREVKKLILTPTYGIAACDLVREKIVNEVEKNRQVEAQRNSDRRDDEVVDNAYQAQMAQQQLLETTKKQLAQVLGVEESQETELISSSEVKIDDGAAAATDLAGRLAGVVNDISNTCNTEGKPTLRQTKQLQEAFDAAEPVLRKRSGWSEILDKIAAILARIGRFFRETFSCCFFSSAPQTKADDARVEEQGVLQI